ncbi:unnamed protein product [Ectocarpus sp. CCAP 1310/34]|nr:unnamed protein product [Ectocarpus sp. CCAP 1310/34]
MVMLGCQDVGRSATLAQGSGYSKSFRQTPKALKRGAGFQQSGSHDRHFLVLVTSAMVVGVAESKLVEFRSGFKCIWYDLPHPVQFAVLLMMPALFFGINWIFGKLDKVAYARLSRAVTAWMDEKRQLHRI